MENRPDMARAAAEAAARRSYGKLVAWLAARTRDVAGAEDALADAFAARSNAGRRTVCRKNRRPGCWPWRDDEASMSSDGG